MVDRPISPPRSKAFKRRASDSTARSTHQHEILRDFVGITSWNINGIHSLLQNPIDVYFRPTVRPLPASEDSRASQLRSFLRRHGWPTCLFLQEVKINPDDSATIRAVEKAVERLPSEPDDAYDYEAHFCLPSDKFNARGFGRKVYGVCSIVRKDFSEQYVERIRSVDWDAEGRFLVIETKAQPKVPKLAIFNVYLVNGTDNIYKDPVTGQKSGERHDRKLAVHALLQKECQKLEDDGYGVIIAGDINIARTPMDGHPNLRTFPKQHRVNRADFEAKFFSESITERTGGGLAMIDTFRHLHPERKGYTYYPRTEAFGESCDRVDMVLISKSLAAQLKEAGMHETPAERGPSDHVPLHAYLDFGESENKRPRKV